MFYKPGGFFSLSLSRAIAALVFGLNEDLYPFPIWRGDSSDVMKQGDWIEIHLRLFFSPPSTLFTMFSKYTQWKTRENDCIFTSTGMSTH